MTQQTYTQRSQSGLEADYQPAPSEPQRQWQQNAAPTRVVVTDINMSFGAMVVFMVKWSIAAIPALIILLIIGGVISLVAGIGLGVLGGLFSAF